MFGSFEYRFDGLCVFVIISTIAVDNNRIAQNKTIQAIKASANGKSNPSSSGGFGFGQITTNKSSLHSLGYREICGHRLRASSVQGELDNLTDEMWQVLLDKAEAMISESVEMV